MRRENTAPIPRIPYTGKLLTLLLAVCFAFAGTAYAQEGLVSSMEMLDGVTSIDGIRLAKPADRAGTVYTEDYGTSQVLEIIRPNMGPIVVGRLSTSCSCIRASMDKKSFAQGERAFIEVRNVKQSQPNGATYAVWAQLVSPYRANLQFELFVKSDRQPGDPVPVTIVPEVIVPSAGEPPVAVAPAVLVPKPSGNPSFRYEDIAPYTPKAVEERDPAESAAEETEAPAQEESAETPAPESN